MKHLRKQIAASLCSTVEICSRHHHHRHCHRGNARKYFFPSVSLGTFPGKEEKAGSWGVFCCPYLRFIFISFPTRTEHHGQIGQPELQRSLLCVCTKTINVPQPGTFAGRMLVSLGSEFVFLFNVIVIYVAYSMPVSVHKIVSRGFVFELHFWTANVLELPRRDVFFSRCVRRKYGCAVIKALMKLCSLILMRNED